MGQDMRVLISSVGTRGDVQPALALAIEMRKLGHEVRPCVPPNVTGWAARLGFDARPIGIEMRAPKPGAPPPLIPDLITDQFDAVAALAVGCDRLVGAGVHQYALRSIAALRGIPSVVAVYAPISLPVPGEAWDATRGAWNARSLERVNANRTRLGLPPVDDVLSHILGDHPWLAADATLGPAPTGLDVVQTGAWILPDTTPLAAPLEAFLDAGDPPVYLGFGSMPAAPGFSGPLIAAVRAAGRRVLLSEGWAGLAAVDDAGSVARLHADEFAPAVPLAHPVHRPRGAPARRGGRGVPRP
jgi:vancomycin aglycone glucosyltransferase